MRRLLLICWLLCGCARLPAAALQLVADGKPLLHIALPATATREEQQAADLLQDYIRRITGATMPIVTTGAASLRPAIYIGGIADARQQVTHLTNACFSIAAAEGNVYISSRQPRGLRYAVYTLLEQQFGCRKYSAEPAYTPRLRTLTLPGDLLIQQTPAFQYREAYFPAALDDEYLDWHHLQRFEQLWGLWGHSFFKLVPPQTYFPKHPEYFALVDGKRRPTQLCLSNEAVYKLVVAQLRQRMVDDPAALYWSVSPEDGDDHCSCPACKQKEEHDGGPQGSLIQFVNRVASAFPSKQITTLAYGYSRHAPLVTKPAANVTILLSCIDAYRDQPLARERTAAGFREDLRQWQQVTPHIFVWDYVTQFTNYLAPFPIDHCLQPNLQYLQQQGVQGVLEQGSGGTPSDFSELRTYLLAKLLWNTAADTAAICSDFFKGYYGRAAPFVQQYYHSLQAAAKLSGSKADIYGNPISAWNSYLSPELIDQYSNLLDKAEAAVETDTLPARHVAGLAAANLTGGYNSATVTVGAGVSSLNLATAAGAQSALSTIDAALQSVNTSSAALGAFQNRFQSAVSSLQTYSQNLQTSRSRIQDTDFASETASMTRSQVLQQAGTAILAQANSSPNGILALLR